jgi:hypothetical protein
VEDAVEDDVTVQNSHSRYLLLMLVAAMLVAQWVPARAAAGELNGEQAVEAGRRALSGRSDFPWYDSKKDELRRIDVSSRDSSDDPGNRASTWQGQAAPVQQNQQPTFGGFGQVFWALLQALFWLVLIALLGVLAWLIVRAFLNREADSAYTSEATDAAEASGEVDRIEKLPFQMERPKSDLLAEARRQYEAGNFGEAIIYLFSYQLVELDKHHYIRLTKGKTNRQYLWELRPRPPLVALVESTMLAFEDVFFGHYRLERERFEQCWRRLDDFQQLVEHSSA